MGTKNNKPKKITQNKIINFFSKFFSLKKIIGIIYIIKFSLLPIVKEKKRIDNSILFLEYKKAPKDKKKKDHE